MDGRALAKLAGWWVALLGLAAGLVAVHDLRAQARPAIIILLVAGGVYAAACLWLHRRWPGWSTATARRSLLLILLGGLLLRLLLLSVPPTLSDDIYRYRWDGKVQSAGLNPYAEPPAAASLNDLRDELWEGVNYKRIRTIYPPLAQWLFALTYQLDGGLLAYQVVAVVGDQLVALLLLAALSAWRLPRWRVALWAWHPLAAAEFASSGHLDAWPVAAVLLAILAWRRKRTSVGTLALAAGILLKIWPILLAPLLVVRKGWRPTLLLITTVAGAYGFYLGAGAGILQPWLDYSGRWQFNDAFFWGLHAVTGSQALAKALAAILGLGLLRQLWHRNVDALRGSYWLLLAALMLMPTVHPWYLLWPLPLAALALDTGWIALTVLAPLAYWILVGAGPDSNAWVEPVWVRFFLYPGPLVLWVVDAARRGPAAPPALGSRRGGGERYRRSLSADQAP